MEDRTRVHVFVDGELDASDFPQAVADKALELGVAGWVRMLSDGRVEAVLEGPRDEVYRVVGLCRAGPNGVRVAGVQVDRESPRDETTFTIK
ncbi:MAG TPA: acylphosphatase [Actinomycetota bacterium]|nr:acylphosphatase [Actinomycetota bacterium]